MAAVSQFIVGAYGAVQTSPDGTTWTNRPSLMSGPVRDTAYSSSLGLYVAVGSGSAPSYCGIATSPDGITWTPRSVAPFIENRGLGLVSVAWSPEQAIFVAVGGWGPHAIVTSTDGITWTERTSTFAATAPALSVEWIPAPISKFFMVGGAWPGQNCSSSSDGITWSANIYLSGMSYPPNAIAYSPLYHRIVIGAAQGMAAWSDDGITFTVFNMTGFGTDEVTSIEWSPELGYFLAFGGNNASATSPDGKTWTFRGGAPYSANRQGLTWSASLNTWMITCNGDVEKSPTGLSGTWTLALNQQDYGAKWFPYVNLAPNAPTLTSPNGGETVSGVSPVTWTAATDPDSGPSALTYQVDASSDNGATWTTLGTGGATATSCYANFSLVTPSATCLVRIRAFDGAAYGPYDQSNAVFTVVAPTPILKVDVGSFTKTAGPTLGNQDIVIPRDLTTAPVGTYAIMFWTAGSDQASGIWDAGYEACIGFTTGAANSYAVGWTSTDALAAPTAGVDLAAKCLAFAGADGATIKAEADFVSFPDATHMRINWTTNANDALFNTTVINYMIISGLTGAKIVDWTAPITAIDNAVIGAGFTPDLVLNVASSATTLPLIASSGHLQFGAFNKHGQQWAYAEDAGYSSPANTSRWQQTDALLLFVSGGEGAGAQAHFKSMDADGFTTNFSTAAVAAFHIFSLCIKGVSSKIGAFTSPAAVGAQQIDTRQGFTPKGALFSSLGLIPTGAPAAGVAWSLGATDMTNRRAIGLTNVDNVNPSQVKSVGYTNAEIISGTAGATTDAGSITATSGSQTTVNWTTKDAVAREYLYLLLGDAGTDTFPAKVAV